MQSSPLHLTSHTHYYRGGEVTIDPSAAIAAGVVLQALPGAAIQIGPSACLGAGVVIQAKSGTVMVESGASLGASVLIVGHGHIGESACVGPASTLLNPQVQPHEVIPPNSLIGDQSRSRNGLSNHVAAAGSPMAGATRASTPAVSPRAVSPRPVDIPDIPLAATAYSQPSANEGVPGVNGANPGSGSALTVNGSAKVYGRDQVDTLLSALFPHRQPLNPPKFEEDS